MWCFIFLCKTAFNKKNNFYSNNMKQLRYNEKI